MDAGNSLKRPIHQDSGPKQPTKKNRSFSLDAEEDEQLLSDDSSDDDIEVLFDSAPKTKSSDLSKNIASSSVNSSNSSGQEKQINQAHEEYLMDDDSIDQCTSIELMRGIQEKGNISSSSNSSSQLIFCVKKQTTSKQLMTDDEDDDENDDSRAIEFSKKTNSESAALSFGAIGHKAKADSATSAADLYNGPLLFRRDVVSLANAMNAGGSSAPVSTQTTSEWKKNWKWKKYDSKFLARSSKKVESDTDSSSGYELIDDDPVDNDDNVVACSETTVSTTTNNVPPVATTSCTADPNHSINKKSSKQRIGTRAKKPTKFSSSTRESISHEIECSRKPVARSHQKQPSDEDDDPDRRVVKSYDSYVPKSNVSRFSQSNFDIFEILKQKRKKHGHEQMPEDDQETANCEPKRYEPKRSEPKISKAKKCDSKRSEPKVVMASSNSSEDSSASEDGVALLPHKRPTSSSAQQFHDKRLTHPKTAPMPNQLKESFESILNDILTWKASWLKEELNDLMPPNLCKERLIGPKLCYNNFDEYFSVFKPLILLEIWANLLERFLALKSQPVRNVNLLPIAYSESGDFVIFTCKMGISRAELAKSEHPGEGDLVLMEMHATFDAADATSMVVFGYVHDMTVQDAAKEAKTGPAQQQPQFAKGCDRVVRYSIKTRALNLRLDTSKPIRARPVFYIRPHLRQCEAICALQLSPLKNAILKPNFQYSQVSLPEHANMRHMSEYNASQQKTISASFELVKQPSNINKILLVQGPPGTGKTHTIVGMVKKIYLDWDNDKYPKILICAPSNGAIDEIAARLYRIRGFLTKKADRALRLVRVGQDGQISQNTKKIFIDNLIESNLDQIRKERSDSQLAQIEELDVKLKDFTFREKEFRQRGISPEEREFKRLLRDKNKLVMTMAELRKANDNHEGVRGELDIESIKKNLRRDIIMKADIILSTLNSCRTQQLTQIYREIKSFHCCIVDEASQCAEPEILMPLNYLSITKFILIGDPMQLPATVISSKAMEYHYGRSLFERHFSYFNSQKKENNPILMLDTQYRMHSEICQFPSNFFYSNLLVTDPSANRRQFPMLPYALFDISGTKENSQNPKNIYNKSEGDFVVRLYHVICSFIKQSVELSDRVELKIGIITPYQGQKRYIQSKLGKQEIEVEVNTIDGFQGQERDIIVISAVRAFDEFSGLASKVGFLNSKQRLNVAITRAKHSLFICMESQCIQQSKAWKLLIDDAVSRRLYFTVSQRITNDKLNDLIHEKSHPNNQRSYFTDSCKPTYLSNNPNHDYRLRSHHPHPPTGASSLAPAHHYNQTSVYQPNSTYHDLPSGNRNPYSVTNSAHHPNHPVHQPNSRSKMPNSHSAYLHQAVATENLGNYFFQ